MQVGVADIVDLRIGRTAQNNIVIVLVAPNINCVDRRSEFEINRHRAGKGAAERDPQIHVRPDDEIPQRRS